MSDITPVLFDLTIPKGDTIAGTLRALNTTKFDELWTGLHHSALTALNFDEIYLGLAITAGTFPDIHVSAGGVIEPSGQIHSLAAGTLTLPATADTVSWIFIDADFNVDFAASLPVDAVFALAVVTNDGAGAAFLTVNLGVTAKDYTWDAVTDALLTVTYRSGSIVTRTITYTVDADGSPITATETFAGRTYLKTYGLDELDELETVTTTRLFS